MGVGLFSKGTVAEVFIHLAGFKICCKQQIQPAIIIDVGKVSGKCKVCIAYQICKACLGIQTFKPDPLRAAYVAPQVGWLFAAQSGAAPMVGQHVYGAIFIYIGKSKRPTGKLYL